MDLDFCAQFQIVRPTMWFSKVLGSVPGMFVGGAEELKRHFDCVRRGETVFHEQGALGSSVEKEAVYGEQVPPLRKFSGSIIEW